MTRLVLPALLALAMTSAAFAQTQDFPAPKTFPPDAATRKKIEEKTAELKAAITVKTSPDVAVYLKAAEWIVRHGEWYTERSAQQTLDVLEAGLKRTKDKDEPWLKVRGKPIIRGYNSRVDGSIQPFSVRYPDDFDPKKKYRADIILHGRDATLTEVKFIHAKETAKPGKPLDHFEVEVYGRGNNAYRWAGETDVFEVISQVKTIGSVDDGRVVLRGFSMGGAGTWHIGLHHPFDFAVLGPGAGFTTTRGYIAKFPPQPDYIEKCLHIYDAVDYAENVFNVPVVAYSGEKDKQKAAADNIEAALKNFKEPHSFTHLVAPGLEHKQPPEWMTKLETEYQKHLKNGRPEVPEKIRFVTYTPRYMGLDSSPGRIEISALDRQYEKAVLEGTIATDSVRLTTTNVRAVGLLFSRPTDGKRQVSIDGQPVDPIDRNRGNFYLKESGKWRATAMHEAQDARIKKAMSQGPIDDAFGSPFAVVGPTGKSWNEATAGFAQARQTEFAKVWEKHFRGELPTAPVEKPGDKHLILFGDPQSNPLLAKVLPKLPIKWSKDELVVNGVKYDSATHVPVLIYPSPLQPESYVVINSGHTFREADLKGTNALLYPRLGDWAVLKPKPTKDDPAGFEVVAAGLFDENWQFPKK